MTSPYLNTTEAAIYLRFIDAHGAPNLKQCREFLIRHRVKTSNRGRSVLVHRDALDAALTPISRGKIALVRRRA